MSKIRISTLLSPDTLDKVKQEAKEKSISESAVIRQKVEEWYNTQEYIQKDRCFIVSRGTEFCKPKKS